MPASSACRASCSRRRRATYAIASGLVASKSGKRFISNKLKSSHPLLQDHRTSVVFHEPHESIQGHCLGSLDEMWSQESFEIICAVFWVSQQLSVQ